MIEITFDFIKDNIKTIGELKELYLSAGVSGGEIFR